MDLETVKICFGKFVKHMNNNEKVPTPKSPKTDQLSIHDINRITQTIFMDYIIKNENDRINQNNIPCVLYKQMNYLIEKTLDIQKAETIDTLKQRVFNLEDENRQIKNQMEKQLKTGEDQKTQKSWFF